MKCKRLLLMLLLALVVPWAAMAQQALPYSYGFEDNNLSADGWTTQNPSGLDASNFGIRTDAKKTGDYGFQFSSYDDNGEHTQYLISPELNATTGVVAQFYYKAQNSYGTELFKVGYSTTDNEISSFTFGPEISTSSTSWTQSEEFSFPAGTKYVAVYYYSDWQYYLYVDDFTFEAPSPCPKPTDLDVTLTSGDGTKATFSWTENGTATQWQLCLNGDETNLIEMTENPFTYTGLTAETPYTAKVRAYCDATEQSAWSNEETFTPTNASSITVNDGTATNTNVPITGNYCDYGNRSQFIIPAESLASMQWGTINKLTFYANNTTTSNFSGTVFEVYMVEVPNTAFESQAFVDWTTLEKVYDGSLVWNDKEWVFELTETGYQYTGGNLLIGFYETSYTSSYGTINWLGVNQTTNTALRQNASSNHAYSGNPSYAAFLPKTTFEFTPGEEPPCPKPTGLTPSYTGGTEATLSWTSDAEAWQICLNDDEENLIDASTNPYTLTGLELATTYNVKVRAFCNDRIYSDWSNPVSFTTDLCMPENQCQSAMYWDPPAVGIPVGHTVPPSVWLTLRPTRPSPLWTLKAQER